MEDAMHLIGPLILILVIVAAVWFFRGTEPGGTNSGWPRIEWSSLRSPAVDLLEQRYARGEISRQEFLAKKRDLAK
jgi:uncharacterized membrane protein